MRSKLCFIILFLFFVSALETHAQKKAKREPVKHEREIRDMVAFLQFMLNTLGDGTTSSRDKDVLITESYTKIFRDAKVQVEDDLDENRKVITNKDVTAYLKDVDFFFNTVKFELNIEDIQNIGASADKVFYKVTLTRNLKGTTVDGKAVNKTIPRNIEINYNEKDQDLKIVSIYTNLFNEKEALLNWWNGLSYEWKGIFIRKLNLPDSVSLNDIRTITAIENLDVSGNEFIQSIEPVAQLLDLKDLNLSNTNISDLSPIRNLTNLLDLNLSASKVEELSALRYSSNLKELDISHTIIDSITVVEKLANLQVLNLSGTNVVDFDPLKFLTSLQYLNLESTAFTDLHKIDSLKALTELHLGKTLIQNLTPITNLSNLNVLDLDSTRITEISALSSLKQLKVLSINNTAIADLDPLQELVNLEKIYCDHTGINQSVAGKFMATHPKTLVIFDSEDLKGWWDNLEPVWKDVLSRRARVGLNPTKEELAKVTNLDSVSLSNYVSIKDLEPLRKLQKLKTVIVNRTGITDLSPLQDHSDIQFLDISDTKVQDLSPLRNFAKLKILRADQTGIQNIDTIATIKSLQRLYVDQSNIEDAQAREFLVANPTCLVVYKTTALDMWWSELSEDWKQVFQMQLKVETKPTRENAHKLILLESIQFGDVQVNDLSPLNQFVRLKELRFSGTAVTDLAPLVNFKTLRILHINDNPIRNTEPIRQLAELEDLDISNTPINELEDVSSLKNLKKLNCAGTQVKKLNELEGLKSLEFFDCSNTDVKNLDAISGLPLKTLKCYNSKVSKTELKKFQKNNPDCNVIYYR